MKDRDREEDRDRERDTRDRDYDRENVTNGEDRKGTDSPSDLLISHMKLT